jgi:hypothetical protein
MRRAQTVEPHTGMQPSPAARTSRWPERVGWVLSGLVLVFFLIDAMGKLLQVPQVLSGSQDLGYPLDTVVPIGLLLLVGAVLYALPRSAVLGAIYLTAFLGGAVAAHARIGSPLFTHILFGVYVAVLMWAGLVLRRPALLGILLGRR